MKLFLLALLPAVALALPSQKNIDTLHRWYDGPCGVSKYDDAAEPFDSNIQIVGGIEAREHEFPHQAQMQLSGGRWCGGSLINEQWVLTAAHCIFFRDQLSIVLKQHNVDEVSGDEIHLALEDIFVHPDYPQVDGTDIALMKLEAPVSFDEDLQPVCSPDPAKDYVGADSSTSGWGDLEHNGAAPSVLNWVSLPVPTNGDCEESNRAVGYNPGYWPPADSEICAGEVPVNNERDSCQGDSGGPLTVREDGVFSLIGVVSHGYGCASGAPGIYTRVTSFLDWIDETIANN